VKYAIPVVALLIILVLFPGEIFGTAIAFQLYKKQILTVLAVIFIVLVLMAIFEIQLSKTKFWKKKEKSWSEQKLK